MSDWKQTFKEVYHRTAARVRAGERRLDRLFTDADREFLRSIGSKPIEMFDACDDYVGAGEPTPEETLRMHEIRRELFLHTPDTGTPPRPADVRPRDSEVGGIRWLPRAIDKVRAKLEGRLPDELYYPCGGDRRMLRDLGLGPVELFEIVRDNATDEGVLSEITKRRMKPALSLAL